MFEPRTSDLDLVDVDNTLLRAPCGLFADETATFSAAQLRALAAAVAIRRPDYLRSGRRRRRTVGPRSPSQTSSRPSLPGSSLAAVAVGVLSASVSIADGQPIGLGDLAAGLDRRAMTLLLAAIAHDAAATTTSSVTRAMASCVPGIGCPSLVACPLRDWRGSLPRVGGRRSRAPRRGRLHRQGHGLTATDCRSRRRAPN